MVDEGITSGYSDGTFRPTAVVTRQTMAAFLYKAAGPPPFTPPASAAFTDVPPTHQFYEPIMWMVSEGITQGYSDGTFRPTAKITRQSAAAFLYNLHHRSGEEGEEVIVSPDTLVLDAPALAAITSVTADQIVVSELAGSLEDLSTGRVLAAGVSPTTPGGLLRRVTGVTEEDGSIVVETVDAALDEAIEQAEIHEQFVIDASTAPGGASSGAGTAPGGGAASGAGVAYELPVTFAVGAMLVEGTLGISATVDFDLDIDKFPWPKVETASVTTTASVYANLDASANVSGEWDAIVDLAEVEFGTYTVMVGPVPIVVTPELGLVAAVSVSAEAGFEFGASGSASVSVEVAYDDDEWDTDTDDDVSFVMTGLQSTTGAVDARLELLPSLGLEFYKRADIEVTMATYLGFTAQMSPCLYTLVGGMDASLGVEASILGKDLLDEEFGPLELFEKTLYQGTLFDACPPVGGG